MFVVRLVSTLMFSISLQDNNPLDVYAAEFMVDNNNLCTLGNVTLLHTRLSTALHQNNVTSVC